MSTSEACRHVYRDLLQHCLPGRIEGLFDFVPPDSAVYRAPADPAAVLAELSQKHAEPVLLASGVAIRNGTGPLTPWRTSRRANSTTC